MGILTKIFGNPGEILGGVKDIIGSFVTDPNKKLEAELALAKLESDFQGKLLDADVEFAKAQSEVLKAEAQSASWLARNWRPITMLVFVFIIAYNYIFAQIFSLKMLTIEAEMWALLKLGIGGYVIGRSAEKMVPSIAKAIKK